MISDEVYKKECKRILTGMNYTPDEVELTVFSLVLTIPVENRDSHLELLELQLREYQDRLQAESATPLEKEEQKRVVSWFKSAYPRYRIMSVRNDGFRLQREKTEQINMGMLPGASDLYIPHLHAWVEMKRAKKSLSVWSQEQKEFCRYVREKCGDTYLLCYGADDAQKQIGALMETKK